MKHTRIVFMAAMLLLSPAWAATPATRAPLQLPSLPSWARNPTFRGPGQWEPFSVKHHKQNLEVVGAANAAGERLDFVLFGDSITLITYHSYRDVWDELFPASEGWNVAGLGVAGNDIEDLTWRLLAGQEMPQVPPAVVGVLIGTNDIMAHKTAEEVEQMADYLMQWLQAALPDSHLLLINLLPRADPPVEPYNDALEAVAAQHNATWSTCGSDIDPFDQGLLYDGTHPTRAATVELLSCLRPVVAELAGKE